MNSVALNTNNELANAVISVRFIIYEKDGFRIGVGRNVETNEKVSIKGTCVPDAGMSYDCTGTWHNDSKYGLTFNMLSAVPHVENDRDSIISFLSGGYIKGVGPKTAEKIYAHFGSDTYRILKEEPEKICEIKGLKTKGKAIAQHIQENEKTMRSMQALSVYGIDPKYAAKLSEQCVSVEECVARVTDNPFVLTNCGMPVMDADALYIKMTRNPKSDVRFTVMAQYTLSINEANGSTGMEINQFGRELTRRLGYGYRMADINKQFNDLLASGYDGIRVYRLGDKCYVFKKRTAEKEISLAKALSDISKSRVNQIANLEREIEKSENRCGVTLDEEQKEAVSAALTNPITVITGYPGTGKTTIENILIDVYERNAKSNAILLSPTGKAARRMEEATGHGAQTIHSFFGIYDLKGEAPEDVDIENALLIMDEFSMVDSSLAEFVINRVKNNVHVVIIGDPDQLASVGAGAVLRDIINADMIPVIRLNTIHRQDKGSLICTDLKAVREGHPELVEQGSGLRFETCNENNLREHLGKLYLDKVNQYGLDNVMCLIPYKKTDVGTVEINKFLQGVVNPPADDKPEVSVNGTIYRVGDLVMQMNKNTEEASNGDTGYVYDVCNNKHEETVTVYINNNYVKYDREMLQNLSLAYAMTVHKSQGGEAKSVIYVTLPCYKTMIYRNIPYVGISRGSEDVTVLGDKTTFDMAVKTFKENDRMTLLPFLLERLSKHKEKQ